MASRETFFVTEGTLTKGAACYVVRKADQDLLESLRQGEFAYVLDSRQKGKSSLMIRVREALEAEGVRTVLLDLQRFGSNLDAEHWYASLLHVVGEQLGNEERLFSIWDADSHSGPMRKFFGAIEQGIAELGKPCVIFIDEIDYVRSLPFSTDEFFAGIRECHNRRASGTATPVAFCLLGVATPSELIRDVRITPFNVGKRIELTDFVLTELAPYVEPLSEGGRDGGALLRRIHHWTGGHPYLTQKLAAAISVDSAVKSAGGVDRLVEAMFFSLKARSEEPNLADVSRRVLESPIEGVNAEEARARVLDLYRQVRESKVRDDDADPVVAVLKLSGLTRVLEGYLVVRNRVYFRAFDKTWVEANLPEAEALRQKRAAQGAAWRVGLNVGGVTLVVGVIAVFGFTKATEAEQEKRAAFSAKRAGDHLLYEADMHLIQTAFSTNQFDRVQEYLDETAKPTYAAFRGPEWGYWDYQMNTQLFSLKGHTGTVYCASFSPDGTKLITGAEDKSVRVWDASNGQEMAVFKGRPEAVYKALFSPDGTRVIAFGWNKTATILDARTGTQIATLKGHADWLLDASFSPDGKRIVTASEDKTARVWDASNGRELAVLVGHTSRVRSASFSPGGTRIVTGSEDKTARVWNAGDGRAILILQGHPGPISCASFSPDGTKVVTSCENEFARVWDARNGNKLLTLERNRYGVVEREDVEGASFSPDGSRVVTTGFGSTRIWDARNGHEIASLDVGPGQVTASFSPDGTRVLTTNSSLAAQVWDARSGRELLTFRGHTGAVISASFSPDGTKVVTASADHSARVWDARDGREIARPWGRVGPYGYASFSPDGKRISTAEGDGSACIRDAWSGHKILAFAALGDRVYCASFSPDGTRVVTGSKNGAATVWDARTGRSIITLVRVPGGVNSASFSPDGTYILTGCGDKTARVCDAVTGKQIAAVPCDFLSDRGPSFSPDGTRVVSARSEVAYGVAHIAAVYNARTGAQIATLKGHAGWLLDASFSPDGKRIVTASEDRTARVWDARTGAQIAILSGHNGPVESASFTPDGTRIVTFGDSTMRLWDACDWRELVEVKVSGPPPSGVSTVSADCTRILTTESGKIQIVPFNRESAAKMKFVNVESWVAMQLRLSAGHGDEFAWRWQLQHWVARLDMRNDELQFALLIATESTNAEIAAEAKRLRKEQKP